jgi:protein-tyrosine-phosphatase
LNVSILTGLSESQLESAVTSRGSNYALMKSHHMIHKRTEESLVKALESRGVETKLCTRKGYEEELIKWADVIFTAGCKKIKISMGVFLGILLLKSVQWAWCTNLHFF